MNKKSMHMVAKWGLLDWLTHGGPTPIVDVFSYSSEDMVDIHLAIITQELHKEVNCLRILVKYRDLHIFISFSYYQNGKGKKNFTFK